MAPSRRSISGLQLTDHVTVWCKHTKLAWGRNQLNDVHWFIYWFIPDTSSTSSDWRSETSRDVPPTTSVCVVKLFWASFCSWPIRLCGRGSRVEFAAKGLWLVGGLSIWCRAVFVNMEREQSQTHLSLVTPIRLMLLTSKIRSPDLSRPGEDRATGERRMITGRRRRRRMPYHPEPPALQISHVWCRCQSLLLSSLCSLRLF